MKREIATDYVLPHKRTQQHLGNIFTKTNKPESGKKKQQTFDLTIILQKTQGIEQYDKQHHRDAISKI